MGSPLVCDATAMFAGQTLASLGSAFMGADSDIKQYNSKIKAINQEADALDQSTIFKYRLSGLQQQQIQDANAAKVSEARLKLAEGTGTATAAAASAGVEGNSVQALLSSFAAATGRDVMFANQQADNELTQAQMEKKGFQMDADARKRALAQQLPEDPTSKIVGRFLNAAFQTGTAYMGNTTKTSDGSGLFGRKFG